MQMLLGKLCQFLDKRRELRIAKMLGVTRNRDVWHNRFLKGYTYISSPSKTPIIFEKFATQGSDFCSNPP
jgi:hypothetical protein